MRNDAKKFTYEQEMLARNLRTNLREDRSGAMTTTENEHITETDQNQVEDGNSQADNLSE